MKKVIVIGGGISGLTSGIYALKVGFDVTIIEKNNEVGGLCTTWTRDNVTIDGCIHWITGSSRGAMLSIYEDLGILDKFEILKPEFFYRFYYKDFSIEVSRDLDDLKAQLLLFADDDNDIDEIKTFIKLVKKLRNVPFHTGKPLDMMNTLDFALYVKSIAPIAFAWYKTINMSVGEFAEQFHNEVLKHFFLSFMPPYYSVTYFFGVIAQFSIDNADTIYATSKEFSSHLKEKFLTLGGKIENNQEIIKLNIENNNIISIESKNKTFSADYIINASPLPYFYNKLLPLEFHDKYVDYIFNDTENYPLLSTVYIAMKIDKEYKEKLDLFTLIYDEEGISLGKSHNETIHYRAYPYNKNKDGSTTLIALIDLHIDDYDIFKEAKENGTYESLKLDLANKALNIYVKKFNDVKDHIEIVDISTPLTFEKYSNTYKGAYLSNLATPFGERKTFNVKDRFIDNLYHGGQWVTQIGGIPRALSNGKFAVDELVYQINLSKKKRARKQKKLRVVDNF